MTNDANVITAVHKAIVRLVHDNRKTDLWCQRASPVASASVRLSYIRCTLITLTQFLTLRSATEPRLEKPITHKRSVNTYGQLWLRHLTCSCHIIFENIFFLVKRLEIGYENEIHYIDFFPIEYNDVFTCISTTLNTIIKCFTQGNAYFPRKENFS